MSRTYAIPDIHGRFDLLEATVAMVTSHAAGCTGTVVTLGDYIDRGPSSRQVVECLRSWALDGFEIINLKGNHETMMLAVCEARAELSWWIRNGGGETLESYGESAVAPNLRNLPPTQLNWIASLPMVHADRHRVYVHAAVDPEVTLRSQNEETLL